MKKKTVTLQSKFLLEDELLIGQEFLSKGYKIFPVTSLEGLDAMREQIVSLAAEFLNEEKPQDPDVFLNSVHKSVDRTKINDLRLYVFERFNSLAWVRETYLSCARKYINFIVGNELVMQRKINLSIQMPHDQSSVLPVHADTWSGDSPYEVVLWIPFVDVSKTKSMFILPLNHDEKNLKKLEKENVSNTEQIMKLIKSDLNWLNVKYGEAVLFSQNLLHGNVINEEGSTRWSMNCRFKSAFSPYSDKKLGEFFEPITLRPATLLGANYRYPKFGK